MKDYRLCFTVDYLQNTAGDIALSYNDTEIYNIIRNAGIRTGTLITSHSTQDAR